MASAGNTAGRKGTGKRVLIIVENLPVPFDRRVWLEAQALRDAGYTVSVICPKMKNFTRSYEELEGIRIYRHPLPYEAAHGALGFLVEYSTALFFEFILTLWIFLRHGFDVIHACNPPDTIFLIGALFKPFGVKFIFDQHDINPELYIAKYHKEDFFYRLLLTLERLTYKTADVVISTNQSYRTIALDRGSKRPEDVFIVRSAPSTDRFHAVLPDPSHKRGRNFLVAYLGVMGKQEGVELLLQAAKLIVNDHERKDVAFVLIGGGPELNNLQRHAAELNLNDHVTFTGRIPDADLLTILSTADVCVNPDRVNEMNDKSTMNKIMEYMAVGKPIVQFEMTEGRYSAQDASLYAEPNNPSDFAEKILHLLADEQKRDQMGTYGLQRLQNELDWKYSKENLRQAYAHALEKSR